MAKVTPSTLHTPPLLRRFWTWLGGVGSATVALSTVLGLVVALVWQTQTAQRWALHREIVSDALVQTQRLAWAATLSPSEDSTARSALLESKQRLSQLFSVLLNGGKLDQQSVSPLPAQLQPGFAEAARWWFRIERAATTLASLPAGTEQNKNVGNLSAAVERFATSFELWADAKRQDLPPLALNTAIQVERLSHILNATQGASASRERLGNPTQIPVLLEAIQGDIDTLLNGEVTKNIKPASPKDRERLLAFRSDAAVLVKLASGVKESLPKLSEGLESGKTIALETELLRRQLSVLLKQLNDDEEPLRWLIITTELLMLALVGLARAQYLLNQSKAQTARIEQQALSLIQSQQGDADIDAKRDGAAAALKGVLAALQQTAESTQKATEQAGASVHIQAQQLQNAGHAVLQLAHAFHTISTQSTAAAKTALQSEQSANQGQLTAHEALRQWEQLREDMRRTAAGLRRAGEASRALGDALETLPTDEQHELTPLVIQTREALRDAVAGLAAGTQHMTQGENHSKAVAAMLAQHQSAWVTLLDRVEVCAGSAAAQAEGALILAKTLSKTGQSYNGDPHREPAQLPRSPDEPDFKLQLPNADERH